MADPYSNATHWRSRSGQPTESYDERIRKQYARQKPESGFGLLESIPKAGIDAANWMLSIPELASSIKSGDPADIASSAGWTAAGALPFVKSAKGALSLASPFAADTLDALMMKEGGRYAKKAALPAASAVMGATANASDAEAGPMKWFSTLRNVLDDVPFKNPTKKELAPYLQKLAQKGEINREEVDAFLGPFPDDGPVARHTLQDRYDHYTRPVGEINSYSPQERQAWENAGQPEKIRGKFETKHERHRMSGGERTAYKERLLTDPSAEPMSTGDGHFPNVPDQEKHIAWTRQDRRKFNGQPSTHLIEVQSRRHQQGGPYTSPPSPSTKAKQDELAQLEKDMSSTRLDSDEWRTMDQRRYQLAASMPQGRRGYGAEKEKMMADAKDASTQFEAKYRQMIVDAGEDPSRADGDKIQGMYNKWQAEERRLDKLAVTHETPSASHRGGNWEKLGFRRTLFDAAENGEDLTWDHGDVVAGQRWRGATDNARETLIKRHNKTLPKIAEQEAKRLGLPKGSIIEDEVVPDWYTLIEEGEATQAAQEFFYLDGAEVNNFIAAMPHPLRVHVHDALDIYKRAQRRWDTAEAGGAISDYLHDDVVEAATDLGFLLNQLPKPKGTPIWRMRLTPEVRAKILKEGLPKFMAAGTTAGGLSTAIEDYLDKDMPPDL